MKLGSVLILAEFSGVGKMSSSAALLRFLFVVGVDNLRGVLDEMIVEEEVEVFVRAKI